MKLNLVGTPRWWQHHYSLGVGSYASGEASLVTEEHQNETQTSEDASLVATSLQPWRSYASGGLFTLATEICWHIVATYSPLAYSAYNYIFPTSALAMTV
jgi:hypothetical protein